LGLTLKDIDEIDSEWHGYYHHFEENRFYNERCFVLLVIILGNGKHVEKANLIFEEWDINIDQNFNREEMTDMAAKYFKLFVEASLSYAIAMEKGEAKAKLEAYSKALADKETAGTEKFTKLLFPNETV
jgi:hypothetical protein